MTVHIRLQYQSRTVPMRDLKYAEPLDLDLPEGSTVQVLDVTPIAQEYRIQYVISSPIPIDTELEFIGVNARNQESPAPTSDDQLQLDASSSPEGSAGPVEPRAYGAVQQDRTTT